jgi:hypothetical protein
MSKVRIWLDEALADVDKSIAEQSKYGSDAELLGWMELQRSQILRQAKFIREVTEEMDNEISRAAGDLVAACAAAAFFVGDLSREMHWQAAVFGSKNKLKSLESNRNQVREGRKVTEPNRLDVIEALATAWREKPAKNRPVIIRAGKLLSVGRDKMYELIGKHHIEEKDWKSCPGSVSQD